MNDKYEFILHYPESGADSYNWWRQSLSPTIQTENLTQKDENDHYVLGYENISIKYTQCRWGGLSLNINSDRSYINGEINSQYWDYAIGAYGIEKGIPAYGPYLKQVALYAKIASLDMIKCISCKICRDMFLNPSMFIFVFILM